MVMAMSQSDRVYAIVYGAQTPSADEWARCLEMCRERTGLSSRFVVETHGGGPDAKQRKALADLLRHEDARVAVLTDSIVARGILTALAWLGLPQRGFAPGDLRGAASYLELSADEMQTVFEELTRLRSELGFYENKRTATG